MRVFDLRRQLGAPRCALMSAPVDLHVYDVSPCINYFALSCSCGLSRWGLYHTGICVHDVELSYGGHPGTATGVCQSKPRCIRGARFRVSLRLGCTSLDPVELRQHLADVAVHWPGCDYHPLEHNCNHFSAALAESLGVNRPPAWTNAFSKSRILRSLLPHAERFARLLPVRPIEIQAETEDSDDGMDHAGGGMSALLLEAATIQKERGNVAYSENNWADALSKVLTQLGAQRLRSDRTLSASSPPNLSSVLTFCCSIDEQ